MVKWAKINNKLKEIMHMARVIIISIGTGNLLGALKDTSETTPKKISELDAESIVESRVRNSMGGL